MNTTVNPFIEKARQADHELERLKRGEPLPDNPETMLELLKTLSDDEIQEILHAQEELDARLAEFGPQNDDELHAWILSELGINIPRVSVCEGHDPPFDFIADLYFERVDAALALGNRSGGKTLIIAILHWINSLFKPGCESFTFGATEAQSNRCYSHLRGWIYGKDGEKSPRVISSLMRKTVFRNTSEVEIAPGTPAAVNGPHPQKAHADEIELMDDATWRESRSLTIGKILVDGRYIKPQDIGTSTRKGPTGRMQKLIDEITDAITTGYKPPRALYQWCIKETAAQVKNCQMAPENVDLPEDEKCSCHRIRKGEWEEKDENGQIRPRLLRDICNGDFYKSRGFQPFTDVAKQFMENDQETFEVQHLCQKPEMRFHYLPKFTEEKHCIRNFDADPANGPIFTSSDWGGTNPSAVGWYQYLEHEIEVDCWIQIPGQIRRIRLRPGTIVTFDEIYQAEIGNVRLGQLVKLKEAGYRRRWGDTWIVKERFADPQGKAAKLDWKRMGLRTSWHVTREFEEHIKVSNDLFDDDLFYVDGEKCPMWVREAKEWRRSSVTMQQIDKFNHRMSDYRYAIANIRHIFPPAEIIEGTIGEVPRFDPIARESVVTVSIRKEGEGPLGFQPRHHEDDFARWRDSLGQPVRRP